MKLLTANMTAYGYALMGAALVDPILKAGGLGPANFVMVGSALALHAIAAYVVPEGEKP